MPGYRFLILPMLVAAGVPAAAQEAPIPLRAAAQFRDAAWHPQSGLVYMAAYDRGEVWAFDLNTGERRLIIAAGKGPVALAIAPDGRTLACANALDGTVSFIRTADNTVLGTTPTGEAPSAVCALPDGRFAVANRFADSVTIVDPAGARAEVTGVPAVPAGIAASGAWLAVIGRAAPVAHIHRLGARDAPRVVKLDAAPNAVAGLGDGSFAISTGTEIVIVDGETGRISSRSELLAIDAALYGETLYVLTADAILRMDRQLREKDRLTLSAPVRQLSAGPGGVALLAPAEKQAFVWNIPAPDTVMEISEAPAAEPAQLRVVEAGEIAAPAPADTLPVEPPAPMPEPVVEPEVAPEPESAVEALPETPPIPQPTETDESAPEDEPAPQPGAAAAASGTASVPGVRKLPLPLTGTSAPRFGRRPSATPLQHIEGLSLRDALTEPTEFGAPEAGFIAPDWTQPFRDIEADEMSRSFDSQNLDLKGNVRLRLGDMLFKADEFTFAEDTGLVTGRGNVHIEQQTSLLTADEFAYQLPPETSEEAAGVPALEEALDEQERARRRFTLGRLDASGVRLVEPTRELHAEHVIYNFADSTSDFTRARGRAGIWYYGGEKLVSLGPGAYAGTDVWVTTCDHDPPHYRLRLSKAEFANNQPVSGEHARLELFNKPTPLYIPRWNRQGVDPWDLDYDSGRRAELGYFLNVGQQFSVTPDFSIGPRFFITQKEGFGLGGDAYYDFMENPASKLYRGKGELHGLYTTQERGYIDWYHRWEHSENLVLRLRAEQWSDEEFYKDFFFDRFQDRTEPRTYANVTYRQPRYIATGTVRLNTHSWVSETERTPEGTFHLLERPLTQNLYLTFDTIAGYNDRADRRSQAGRLVNVARFTYNWDPSPNVGITPFWESQASFYTSDRDGDSDIARLSTEVGVTAQTRLHRTFEGFWGFSAFKHLIVPSLTLSYRPESTVDDVDVPRFDALDNLPGRARIETKLSNIFYGRDAETEEVWQVGRVTFYQGNDLWNEERKAEDYELEIDIRPRPWWGVQLAAERHVSNNRDSDLNAPGQLESVLVNLDNSLLDGALGLEDDPDFNTRYVDYNRVLTQLYFDRSPWNQYINGRIGFAYTETENQVFNREILYGLGYRISDKWAVGFEHRYDFEDGELRSQTYEIRRRLHCWETAIRFRDRESGFDVDFQFNILAFPSSRVKF